MRVSDLPFSTSFSLPTSASCCPPVCAQRTPVKSSMCRAVPTPQRWAWGPSSPAFLTHRAGSGGCSLPAGSAGSLPGHGSSLLQEPGLGVVISSTKQPPFPVHFPLAHGVVPYSRRCCLFPHYSLLAKPKPEKQVDKLNGMFCLPLSNTLRTRISQVSV